MKNLLIYSLAILFLFSGITAFAQDSTTFKVSGECGMCRDRIQKTAKAAGATTAIWNSKTKLLSITYNPVKTNVEKIQNNIVAIGHDIENKKADDKVYNTLPKCCQYRVSEAASEATATLSASVSKVTKSSFIVKGNCGECKDRIENASLEAGADSASWDADTKLLLVVFDPAHTNLDKIQDAIVAAGHDIGYKKADNKVYNALPECCHYRSTTSVNNNSDELVAKKDLEKVVVTGRSRSIRITDEPVRTQTITSKELLKAACCNLSESFETNPSVDVTYNDAVTGSKQIQLLGLSGNYTQLTVGNLPGPRGLATPMGLNSIAGPWIESIQLTKGIGSVVNGYESIAGQINVELKRPMNSDRLYANIYVNDFGKTDLNLNLSQKLGEHWATGLLLHDDFLANKSLDDNKDGYRDQPTGNQFSMVNNWDYSSGKGWESHFGIKILNDKRTGGQTNFNPSTDKLTTSKYGLGINTERYEAFAKTGYVFPKKYNSIGLQLAAISHKQDAYFGQTTYNADQKTFYSNLIYQSIIGTTEHQYKAGLSFVYDKYDEDLSNTTIKNYNRTEVTPGAFVEYTFTPSQKFNVVAGLRADNNSLYGFFLTPRLHVKYEPVKGTTLRASAGRGQRTANIFAENIGAFASSRQMNVITNEGGKAYGLNAEIAWNKGISVDQKFKLFNRNASAAVDFFRNDFTQQVVVDIEDPRKIDFYNLNGKSYSNSFQAELNVEPINSLEVRIAYRYFDVKTDFNGKLLQRPLTAYHRAFTNIAYATKSKWKFDYTLSLTGEKRLPSTEANPTEHQRGNISPAYVLMNAQVSKTFGKKYPMDFYIGGENLTGFMQKNAIIDPEHPFGQYFDASMIWAPITGRMLYFGWRFKIQ